MVRHFGAYESGARLVGSTRWDDCKEKFRAEKIASQKHSKKCRDRSLTIRCSPSPDPATTPGGHDRRVGDDERAEATEKYLVGRLATQQGVLLAGAARRGNAVVLEP